ncbi:hypothetical protein [Desulfosporosinus sp.]|uniref:hypothetical protein n=1 Tax=Desulfosporosinus sp. TaxID=157907 RepID=UPI0025B87C50|nr:hypothetical protein [Desulfosporosinus sp.]MBC2725895.1 hypothetical protein [Desulfosporosinus sp.]
MKKKVQHGLFRVLAVLFVTIRPLCRFAAATQGQCHPEGGTTEGSRFFAIAQDDINLNLFSGQR